MSGNKLGNYLDFNEMFGLFLFMILGAWIAWIYTVAGYPMAKWYAFMYGAGQALCLLIISFIQLFGTL